LVNRLTGRISGYKLRQLVNRLIVDVFAIRASPRRVAIQIERSDLDLGSILMALPGLLIDPTQGHERRRKATMTYVSPSTTREIKAVLFDTFGSVVDWRSGVARDIAAFAKRHRIDLDAVAFADAWRAKYEPSMEPVRNGSRAFVPLDQLHMENLHATLAAFGFDVAVFDKDDLADLNAAWERLDPWQDSVAGLAELGRRVIVGPLSNANLALLLRMALRAKLPWTVIVGSDATRAYKPTIEAYHNMAWMLRLDPGEVMLAAAHNRDLTFAQRAGLGTAFIPRPTEFGAGQTKDLAAEGDWDLVCVSIIDLASRFADA